MGAVSVRVCTVVADGFAVFSLVVCVGRSIDRYFWL